MAESGNDKALRTLLGLYTAMEPRRRLRLPVCSQIRVPGRLN